MREKAAFPKLREREMLYREDTDEMPADERGSSEGSWQEPPPAFAANGCDKPCPYGTFYHCCIRPGPHDGPHYCDQQHSW